jgi:hypothetical protein
VDFRQSSDKFKIIDFGEYLFDNIFVFAPSADGRLALLHMSL